MPKNCVRVTICMEKSYCHHLNFGIRNGSIPLSIGLEVIIIGILNCILQGGVLSRNSEALCSLAADYMNTRLWLLLEKLHCIIYYTCDLTEMLAGEVAAFLRLQHHWGLLGNIMFEFQFLWQVYPRKRFRMKPISPIFYALYEESFFIHNFVEKGLFWISKRL